MPDEPSPLQFEQLEPVTIAEAEAALARGDALFAARAVVAIGLHSEQPVPAAAFLAGAASYPQSIVSGNVLIAFSHLARRFGALDRDLVEPIVRRGLQSADTYVRGHAEAAADDLEHFLGWQLTE